MTISSSDIVIVSRKADILHFISKHDYVIVDQGDECLLFARQPFAFEDYSYAFDLGKAVRFYDFLGRTVELPADKVAELLNKYNKNIFDMRD